MAGEALTLTGGAEGAEPESGSLAAGVAVIKMAISPEVPMKTELCFYREDLLGTFLEEGKDEGGSTYASQLVLNPDGHYSLAVQKDGAPAYEEQGSFAYGSGPMGATLTLTASDGMVSTGMVADAVNITHNVDAAMNTLGFRFTR